MSDPIRDFILAMYEPERTPEFIGLHIDLREAKKHGASERMIDQILAGCTDPECIECGSIICPHGEALHFHHDGCPACDGGA